MSTLTVKRTPKSPRRPKSSRAPHGTEQGASPRVAPRSDPSPTAGSGAHQSSGQDPAVLDLQRPKLPRRPRVKRNDSSGDLWRNTAGDHGYAVTVYEKRGRRSLYITWWNPKTKRMERDSLQHAHREKAIAQARLLSDKLRLGTESGRTAPAVVTNEFLLESYYREHGRRLTGSQPAEHRRR